MTTKEEQFAKSSEICIRKGLDMLADISLEVDTKEVGHLERYTGEDLLNALLCFNHVIQNIAYFKNPLPEKNQQLARAELFGSDLRNLVHDFSGFDPADLASHE